MANIMGLASRLLPRGKGTESRSGADSGSAWAPSLLTTLSDRAAQANNELPGP
jgi:hypothetical protein